MQRRNFIKQTALSSTAVSITFPTALGTVWNSLDIKPYQREDGNISGSPLDFPTEKRVPLGYRVFSVPAEGGQNPILTFNNLQQTNGNVSIWLRLTSAIDFREEKTIRAYLPQSNKELGIFQMIYAHPFQPFEITINPDDLPAVAEEGIGLQLTKGDKPAWFYAEAGKAEQGLNAYLIIANDTKGNLKAFQDNLYSMNSFGPFGWIGGCVLDALWERHRKGDLQALKVLQSHLTHFLNDEIGVIFENPHTSPMDGSFNSIEDFLPFVPIAGLYTGHMAIDNALEYLTSRKDENGLIYQGHITTEGCYTVAYPLAFIAALRKDKALAKTAFDQLILRVEILQDGSKVFQRATSSGHRSYQNWGRGVAWYLLGIIKTMKVLRENGLNDFHREQELIYAFAKLLPEIVALQNKQGMWCAYIDRQETEPDTSATAGIATAIAHAIQMGMAPEEMLTASEKAFTGLQAYLAADGWLQGMTQINRGGEDLQANGYRVMSHFGLGLMAQLQTVLA